ncbi:MAG: murein transglycosylase [Rhodospirillaceae bacterium]|nr:murein transglycosylase [Rhodospirillaceae bacterium]MBT4463816.1 murein transglycosylase [Rhodospirillaceae bacterium]MBT5308464.1 murein transglycosylase [Rhodospirillaceae bacterium]MBT6406664.1 murein transglycosylase [Rhodospirillaceae bacterium]MBT7356556.1 murein transglycosylase [Rhodospirillaceae bacterium]
MRFPALFVTLGLLAGCGEFQIPPQTASVVVKQAPVAEPASRGPQQLHLTKTTFAKLPGWRGDQHTEALKPLLRSCEKFAKAPPERILGTGALAIRVADMLPICAAARTVPANNEALTRAFFESRFQPWLATADGRPEGLFTGYFEIELKGSWLKNKTYGTPLYERPPELIEADLGAFSDDLKGRKLSGKVVAGRFLPFDDRRRIEGGSLSGRALELLWVDDPVDAFFLHVQGSGRVRMDDGSLVRVGFAGRNGHAYRSIGRALVDMGEMTLERVSMQSIRAWMVDNPGRARELMASNLSFIFFRVVGGALKSLPADAGPVGAQGVSLTAGRSLAVDRRYLPLGLPIWLDTTDPLDPSLRLQRLVVAQDTGSAITGPVRGDLFWGFGDEAATRAGLMKQSGRYFLLLPRS